jgi:hypothetical protein
VKNPRRRRVEWSVTEQFFHLVAEHRDRLITAIEHTDVELDAAAMDGVEEVAFERAYEELEHRLTADEWAAFRDAEHRLGRSGRTTAGSARARRRWLAAEHRLTNTTEPIEVLVERLNAHEGYVARVPGHLASAPAPTPDQAWQELLHALGDAYGPDIITADRFTLRQIDGRDPLRRV